MRTHFVPQTSCGASSKLADVPEGASPAAAPVTVSVTLLVIVVTVLRGSGLWQLWGPVVGVVAGTANGGLVFGLYDTASVGEAGWVGLPPLPIPDSISASDPSSGSCCRRFCW